MFCIEKMKISTSLLLTLIILASNVQVIHTECAFQCESAACDGGFATRLFDEQTSPGLVYTAEVDSGVITSSCLDEECGLFSLNNENVSFVGEVPDVDTDASGKDEKVLGIIGFSCTSAGGSMGTLTLLVSAVNTNDNKATFAGKTEYETTLPELAKPGVVLNFGEIILNDMDRLRDQLSYELITEDVVPFEVIVIDSGFNANGKIEFQVKVKNPPAVDFERVQKYNLTLDVTDAQAGTFEGHVSSVNLIITIEDLDDQDPVFNYPNYAATIEEGTAGILTVTPEDIDAYDQDIDLNVAVVFSITNIVGDCPADNLEINANIGIVSVNDTGLKPGQCDIELMARQVDDDQRSAKASLMLTVSDIDTSCPGFEDTQLTGRVDPEDAFVYRADGVDKLLLQVTDNDATFSGSLTLHDLEQHPFRLATEGTEQGAITLYFNVTDSPVLMINQTYDLKVTVSADNCTEEETFVEITVVSLAPQFARERYDTEILEGSTSVSPIETVSAVSLGAPNKISYFLKSATNGGENFFEVGRNSGEIFLTSAEVDAERVERFILFIEALDRSWEPSRVSFAYVFVTVNDSNDNCPIFQDTPYEVAIPEKGYDNPIFTVQASDDDASDILQYSMLTEDSPFEINNEGDLSVVGELDVDNVTDSQLEFTLVVSVSDGMNDVSVNVTIVVTDVNDNPPVFVKDDYVWELPEGEPLANKTFKVAVMDKDSDVNITFSLADGSDNRFQLLDPKIGEITAGGTFDRETKEEILLVVMAMDGEFTSNTTVTVMITDINDNNPEFIVSSATSLEVAENAEIGTLVFSFMVTDADKPGTNNSKIMLSIQDDTDFGIRVADDGDGYQLFVNSTLDRETRETYEMTIVASNPGFPEVSDTLNVTVTLLDVNDNAPEFHAGEEDIPLETAATFDLIANLSVIDRDKEPNYFKFSSSGEDSKLFFVSPTDNGCLVFLKSKLDLSSEPYILYIEVWNPDSPELKEDHSTIRLRVFYGVLPCFEIIPKHLELTRVDPGEEEFDIFQMSVNISDCSDPSNESDILFNVTRAMYKEDLDTAYYEDTDDVLIDEVTGDLSLRSPSPGLYDILVEAYNGSDFDIPLAIRMYSRVEVRLTEAVNNRPMFIAPEFIIPTRTLPVESGTELWDFSKNVTDLDSPAFGNGELLFFIDGVECDGCDASGVFNMTADGKLILAQDLTTLTIQNVNLTIRAQDRAVEPLNDTARVSLGFRPASLAPPMFVDECETPILIQEESDEVHMLVCKLKAVSGDDLPVIYGFKRDGPGNFTINSATGEILTTRAFDYDDSDRQFELLVFARTSDTSPEGFTIVNVQIIDINDHAPEFLQDAYKFELEEDLDSACQNDSILSREWLVKATDDDSTSINQNIEYFIVGGSEDFNIDMTTGLISKLRCINAENYTSDIMLTVNATNPDAILQPMGSASVSFVVRDLNDNAPIFNEASYITVWVPYLMTDDLIKTVLAQDQDVSEFNSDVTYSFAADQDLNVYRYFTIDETTGEIRTTNVTGYDSEELFGEDKELTIIINARDNGSPPQEADPQGIVAILYDPNNLNEPYFPEKDRRQEIFPPENDDDWCGEFRPPYSSSSSDIIVLYTIIDVVPSNENLTFYLPQNDESKVCSRKSFDREQISEYIITIEATSCNQTEEDCSDSNTRAGLRDRVRRSGLEAVEATSGDADYSVVVITLRVEDVYDATPVFDKDFLEGANKFIIAVPDNTPYGEIIFRVKATDDDAQSHLNYSITYDDYSSTPNFVMDDLTGTLAIQDRVESYLSDVTFDTNKEQAAYEVTLKVTDELTDQGYNASSEVKAKVKLLFIYEYAILVIDKKPKDVNRESAALVECLSDELGLRLVVDSVEAHVILPSKSFFKHTPIEIDQDRTDVWVHMIDMRSGAKFVKYWDFKELWDFNKGKSKCFSTDVTLRPPQPHSVVTEQFDESMIASVALLVMASFIGVSTVLMMVAIIYMWHNVKLQGGRQISRKLDMLMLTENDQLSSQYSGVDNQAFEPDSLVEETDPIQEMDVKVEVGVQAEPAGTSADLVEPAYENISKASVQALQSEPKSALTKGPEHYESQEVVCDFTLEEESDTDTGVADFAHIRTQTYPDEKPGPDLASVEIVNEQSDKLDQAGGGAAVPSVSAEQQDKSGDDAQETTKDPSQDGGVKTEAPPTATPTADVAEEPVQDLCPLLPEDTEVSKKLSASVTESDPKQEAYEDLPPPPPPPPTPGELSADSEPATPKSDPKQATKELDDNLPLPPPPPQLLSNSNEETKSTPSTPQTTRSAGHSGSQSSSEGTPLTDFINGEIPDFLDNLEVTKL